MYVNYVQSRYESEDILYIIVLYIKDTFSAATNDWGLGVPTCSMRCIHFDDCTPYALFTICGILYLVHIAASSSTLQVITNNCLQIFDDKLHINLWRHLERTKGMNKSLRYLSGTRGAKQDVVE